jgi:hypothetical protein
MGTTMLPICFTCAKEMRCFKNGQAVMTSMGLYHGDTYQCPSCHAMVVVDFGREPICQPHGPEFEKMVASEHQHGVVLMLEDL